MKIQDLEEVHHKYDKPDYNTKFDPVKKGDTFTVYHGFRELKQAVHAAKNGISGKDRSARVYSYEADNNPSGLFVTLDFKVAMDFVGAYADKVIVEIVADYNDLESPVWPGGGYTVQGQMSQSFGGDERENKRRRQARRKEAEQETQDQLDKEYDGDDNNHQYSNHIRNSDQKYLADLLTNSREYQALYKGDVSPGDIAAFWVRKDDGKDPRYDDDRSKWTRISSEELVNNYTNIETDNNYRVLQANEPFDGPKWVREMIANNGKYVETALPGMWKKVINTEQQQRKRMFLEYFGQYLWPKQYAGAFKWFLKTYGKGGEDESI